MSEERIEQMRSAIEAAGHLSPEQKAAVAEALAKLHPELARMSQTHGDDAEKITRLVETSAREATRQEKQPEQVTTLLQELKKSVERFETSHPELVSFVAEYSAALSAMGI